MINPKANIVSATPTEQNGGGGMAGREKAGITLMWLVVGWKSE